MKGNGYSRKDVAQLERLLDQTLRGLNEIRDALDEAADPETALETTVSAIGVIGDGLNEIAGRRARRYLRAHRPTGRRAS